MTVFQGAVDATFAAFGIDAVYTPAGGEPVPVRVIARRPDTIVGFGETRIHAETATFELRASEVASPRPGDQLTVGGETFVIQGEPERRDPDRLVWTRGRAAGVRSTRRAACGHRRGLGLRPASASAGGSHSAELPMERMPSTQSRWQAAKALIAPERAPDVGGVHRRTSRPIPRLART